MASGSSDDGNVSPSSASILLAEEAYVRVGTNDTTARARSRDGHTVEVTFWMADPPAVSFFTFRCIKGPSSDSEDSDSDDYDSEDSEDYDMDVKPHVAGAHGRFVLVRTLFAWDDEYEYFIYKGHPKSPSLESVPLPEDDTRLREVDFGIVPRGDDGHYLLIALCDTVDKNDYRLHIYSSEDTTWRTKELPNPCPGVDTIVPDKVFILRDGLLLWVDLLRGMLLCDVFQEPYDAHAQYVPLPEPLPGNRQKVKLLYPVSHFRDLTCVDGVIKFIEIEHRVILRAVTGVPPEKPSDPGTKDLLYDSDLTQLGRKSKENKLKMKPSMNGWSAITWTREIGSTCWSKERIVDVDDILVDNSVLSLLLSSQRSESARSLTFKDLCSAWPTLSTHGGNDVLYLKSFTKLARSVVVAVDLVEKTLTVEAPNAHPFSGKYSSGKQIFRPCALANHLKMAPKITPGLKILASQIAPTGSSASEPNNTAIIVGQPSSSESKNKRPRLSAKEANKCAGPYRPVCAPSAPAHNINGYGNYQSQLQQQVLLEQKATPSMTFGPWAPNLCFNNWISQHSAAISPNTAIFVGQPSSSESKSKYPRLSAKDANKCAGLYSPVCAPLAPAHNINGYGNYQSQLQQRVLLEQQATPSMTFGPWAPNPCFNNWSPCFNNWSSQHPAGISHSYGSHSGIGDYH